MSDQGGMMRDEYIAILRQTIVDLEAHNKRLRDALVFVQARLVAISQMTEQPNSNRAIALEIAGESSLAPAIEASALRILRFLETGSFDEVEP